MMTKLEDGKELIMEEMGQAMAWQFEYADELLQASLHDLSHSARVKA